MSNENKNNNENTNYNQNTDKVVGFKPNLRATTSIYFEV
jgi:hypothetical protein